MSKSGRAISGEPPVTADGPGQNGAQAATKERSWEASLPEFTSTHLYALLGILLVAFGIYGFMVWGGSGDDLQYRAQSLVDAIAANDLEGVKSAAASGQSDDAVRFYENARQKLEPLRKSPSGRLVTSVLVVEKSPNNQKGTVVGIFAAASGTERSERIAKEAGVEKTAVELNTYWTTDSFGRWRLDATKTMGG
jgi:hypothetical protein